ncbi:hypothetical protein AVEN_64737-1, partial [Araneus ventricosus]
KLVLQSWCEACHNIFTVNLFCMWVGRLCPDSTKFAAKLPHHVCHDKLISRKFKLAASVHAIWDIAVTSHWFFSSINCSGDN